MPRGASSPSRLVCKVPAGRDPQPVQTFGSFTADLHRRGRWLQAYRIETVVMQATGVYWMPLYQVLESYGFKVYVGNAQYTQTLPGRKTDVLECQWLQKLHTFGLPNNSFLPPEAIPRPVQLLATARESGGSGGHLHSEDAKSAHREERAVGQRHQRPEWHDGG